MLKLIHIYNVGNFVGHFVEFCVTLGVVNIVIIERMMRMRKTIVLIIIGQFKILIRYCFIFYRLK